MVMPFSVSARRWWFAGVGLLRPLEDLVGRALLDDHAVLHHEDAVAEVADDAEVVRDEEVAHARRLAQSRQQVEDLRLDRHVERRHRLVEHDHGGAGRERAGDGDPLPLAARHPQREAPGDPGREADLLQQLEHAGTTGGTPGELSRRQGVQQDALDVPARVERAQRVLIDDRDESAPQAATGLGQRRPRFAEQLDGSAVEFFEAEREPGGRALARARLPDDAEGLAGEQVERDAVDRGAGPAVGADVALHEATGAQHGHARVTRQPCGGRPDVRHGGLAQGGSPGVGPGHRGDERAGVRMLRRAEHLIGGALLDDLPRAHHQDVVGELCDDGEIVADQQDRGAARLHLLELVEHLRLHGDVERRGRLVGDDDVGLEGDRRRDEGALPQAPGELVRPLPGP
jgi:hypothetical protein